MKGWKMNWKSMVTRRLAVPVIAAGAVLSIAGYEFAKPAHAASAAASGAAPAALPAAGPLDENSAGPILTLDQAMEALTARVRPAVVNVTVTAKSNPQEEGEDDDGGQQQQQQQSPFGNSPFGQFFGMPQQQQGPQIEHGLGSGVIISPNGYIVTNNHVIQGATDIRVTMTDRRIYPAKLVGADPLTDIAVIKIDGSGLPSVPWGESAKLEPGQTVLAFGNPYGFSFTVTRGIISALHRPNPSVSDRHKPGEFIQTDAAINPGNSGGALVNARGELIGINTFLISPSGTFSGMGFAIPTEIVQPTVDKLIKFGKVEHGVMGVSISDVTPENAKFFDMKNATGALVSDVSAGSPADKAGIKTGDIITELDGTTVNDAGELQVRVGQKAPGETIRMGLLRDGKPVTVAITLESIKSVTGRTPAEGPHGKMRWGLGLGELTPPLREQLQLPENVQGVVIGNVKEGSPADNAQLQQGDVLEQVNRKPVHSASEAAAALAAVAPGQDALVLVWSGGGNSFRVMHSAETQDN
jgi:serine protease Do